MATPPNLLTESQALRRLNLADTAQWRSWIRRTLPGQEISTGRLYDRGLVDALHAKTRALLGDPQPEASAPSIIRTSGPVDSGIARTNRNFDSSTLRHS